MSEKLTPIFHACIDMKGTVESHNDVFQEFMSYMDQHMAEYCVNFEDEEGTWFPIELIKNIYINQTKTLDSGSQGSLKI